MLRTELAAPRSEANEVGGDLEHRAGTPLEGQVRELGSGWMVAKLRDDLPLVGVIVAVSSASENEMTVSRSGAVRRTRVTPLGGHGNSDLPAQWGTNLHVPEALSPRLLRHFGA